ncbi:MAG: RagB/SusD family nutrient uptake outer membrane protein [Bacteroidales bacterium]|nr:RagB/SusD family nutrient uptake outer membrane protein [Bacteroidales bacterium]MDD4361792.1 RagB/SusD family nutrient uptake outer membrane protein [Bacteroidales bacterium]MDD4430460.1 RagB/SusD family nutrient uptake outer membrane protein [Bacteroidales bacterium]
MKNTNKIIRLFLPLLLISWVSCSDWLNLLPEDSVPKQAYWKSKEDVASAMRGIYSSMLSSDLSSKIWLWGEIRADMITNGRSVNAALNLVRQGEISADNSLCNWASFYTTINNCNILLEFAPKAYEQDESFTKQELEAYMAQAVAVRSLMYFYLVRTFGDVPFSQIAYVDDSQYLPLEKTAKNEILDSLVVHLEALRTNNTIPYLYGSIEENKGQMTRYAVDALLADIYLWKEDYAACVSVCDEILNSGQYALIPVPKEEALTDQGDTVLHPSPAGIYDLFQSLYIDGNSVESIFELPFSRDVTNPFYNYLVYSSRTLMPNAQYISSDIFIPTAKGDPEYFDIRASINSKGGYVWKMAGVTYDGNEVFTVENMTNNLIIYRLAQIYLMKAEALTQLAGQDQSKLEEAYELLRQLRDRSCAVETTELERDVASGSIDQDLLELFVMEESARELMFEGKRWFDVLRNAKRNNYNKLNYLMSIVPNSTTPDKVYSLQVKYKNFNSHYLPLPQRDIESNPLLEQNPFYDINTNKP